MRNNPHIENTSIEKILKNVKIICETLRTAFHIK